MQRPASDSGYLSVTLHCRNIGIHPREESYALELEYGEGFREENIDLPSKVDEFSDIHLILNYS
jgi:hypothetical protein